MSEVPARPLRSRVALVDWERRPTAGHAADEGGAMAAA